MGYQTDDGLHEGWEVAELEYPGGRLTIDSGLYGPMPRRTGAGYLDDAAEGVILDDPHVIGWRGLCNCGWRGPLWERVTSATEHDLAARKVFHPDPSLYGVIQDAIHREWLGHLSPRSLADVREAAKDVRKAEARLNETVRRARADGSSWADIGDAAGITRQSAHERWAKR